jgi:hypothetical protein
LWKYASLLYNGFISLINTKENEMSALDKMLKDSGLEKNTKTATKKKTDMVTVEATPAIQKQVDRFLELEEISKNAQTEMDVVCEGIRAFATDYIVKNHETENLIIPGTKGEVNANMKDQYNAVTSSEKRQEIVDFLSKRKIDIKERVIESSKVEFDFNKLTEEERKKLMNFLSKDLGPERYEQVVTTKTTYKLTNLKDEVIKKVKTVKEFQEFRELTSHHSMTIVKRTTKA